jgi:O-antigen/teichoic acid export membrane protein
LKSQARELRIPRLLPEKIRSQMETYVWNLGSFSDGVTKLRRSQAFRGSATNATYSVAEYVMQPLLMIASTPFLAHRLGLDLYGIWMLVSAIAGTMGIFGLGMSDATVKYVSAYRGRNDVPAVIRILRTTLTMTVGAGALAATLIFLAAPILTEKVFKIQTQYQATTLLAIRLGGVVLLLRAVDSVFVSVLRAYETYAPSVRNSILVRVLTIVCALVVVAIGYGVVAIMVATVAATMLGVLLQAASVRRIIPGVSFALTISRDSWAEILSFGFYTWLQNVAGVIFGQADRLLIAALSSTTAVAYYTICVQLAQPVHGFLSAAFNSLFPHISARHEAGDAQGCRRVYRVAIAVNVMVTVLLCAPLIVFGKQILRLWMGPNFAANAYFLLVLLTIAFAILSVNVVPHYTLLALGKARFVSLVNLTGGVLSLIAAAVLIPLLGPIGAALGRMLYAPAITLNYVKVEKSLL